MKNNFQGESYYTRNTWNMSSEKVNKNILNRCRTLKRPSGALKFSIFVSSSIVGVAIVLSRLKHSAMSGVVIVVWCSWLVRAAFAHYRPDYSLKYYMCFCCHGCAVWHTASNFMVYKLAYVSVRATHAPLYPFVWWKVYGFYDLQWRVHNALKVHVRIDMIIKECHVSS